MLVILIDVHLSDELIPKKMVSDLINKQIGVKKQKQQIRKIIIIDSEMNTVRPEKPSNQIMLLKTSTLSLISFLFLCVSLKNGIFPH